MLAYIIKYFFLYSCSLYACTKIMRLTIISKTYKMLCPLLSVVLAIFIYQLNLNSINIKHIITSTCLWIFISLFSHRPKASFIALTISFGISYCIYAMCSFILTITTYLLLKDFSILPYLTLAIISGFLQSILMVMLFQVKRFKKGMTFLISTSVINIATILCLIFISIIVFISQYHSYNFGLFLIIFLLAFLIFWWQAQITKSYRRSLELREQESKRIADLEKDILLQKVLKENERLAHITHRDNTLITTLKNATLNYLSTDYSDSEEALKARDELIANIEALSAGRASLPDNYNEKQARTFDTNFTLLNKLLHQMDADAIQQNIMFSVHFGVMLDEFVPRDISEMDLVHTVDDLLKNAFKATRNSEPRMVQLQFYRLGKHFVVEVADNGIPFEVRSLVNMGMEKLTTYEDGSGIGLVDIWSTKEKCGATYHLEEYVTPSPFSKKISLTFDKKNRYSIRTWRKDEILQMSRRADLQVYEHME